MKILKDFFSCKYVMVSFIWMLFWLIGSFCGDYIWPGFDDFLKNQFRPVDLYDLNYVVPGVIFAASNSTILFGLNLIIWIVSYPEKQDP